MAPNQSRFQQALADLAIGQTGNVIQDLAEEIEDEILSTHGRFHASFHALPVPL